MNLTKEQIDKIKELSDKHDKDVEDLSKVQLADFTLEALKQLDEAERMSDFIHAGEALRKKAVELGLMEEKKHDSERNQTFY